MSKYKPIAGIQPFHVGKCFKSDALLKALKGHAGPAALRDRVMIETLLGTGIRLGELAALGIDDNDLDAKHLRVRAKGNVVQVRKPYSNQDTDR